MLKMPSSLQQCSSSPMRCRFGSAESVVLPVPLRPKSSDDGRSSCPPSPSSASRACPRFGREVVRDREDALLHLAGVLGAEDDELAVLEAEVDARRRAHAGGEAVGGKRAGVVDHEVGLAEARQLLLRRPDQHGVHEERVIRARADDADLDAVLRVPAGEAVEAVEPLARVEVIERALAVDVEGLLVARDVHRAPPDVLLRVRMLDHALVLGRAAGLDAGIGDQRAVLGDAGVLLEANGVLVERAWRQVAVNFGDRQLVLFEVEVSHRGVHPLRFSSR